jgi:acyl-CoA reductase-like NAD-dependent aldehyde dehydrogenase
MITRKLGAVLAAGCTAIVRPAHTSPFSALALARLAEEAQLPAGVLNVVPSSQAFAAPFAKTLCEHADVAGLSFTGSTAVGKILLQLCSSGVKRTSLELGGNAPFVVFESADVDRAVAGCMIAKFRNGGQTCVCANRILVHESIHDEFVGKLADAIRSQLILGDPLDERTTVGPLVSAAALLKVTEHVQDAVANGAQVIVGGQSPSGQLGNGHFYEPTLLVNVSARSRLCHEETFGPVAAVLRFRDEAEALRLANDCQVGLAAYVFGEDRRQMHRFVRQLKVGMVGVNEAMISAAEVPFGGVKESGLGREGSHFGVEEFTNIKYVCEHVA